MLDITTARLTHLSAFWVGNKSRYEGVNIPKAPGIPISDAVEWTMLPAMLKSFDKSEEAFYFYHDEDVSHNAAYQAAQNIFADPSALNTNAQALAQRLYEYSDRPSIKGGEFFAAYFEDILYFTMGCPAIVLWKVQSHDAYLLTERTPDSVSLKIQQGISTGKMEVAALILNTEEAEGYRVYALDKVSKRDERSFWKDDMLRLRSTEPCWAWMRGSAPPCSIERATSSRMPRN